MLETLISAIGAFIKDRIHRKADLKNRMRYDVFQKRLAVYDEIIVVLSSMASRQNLPMDISARDLSRKIFEYAHELKTFIDRLSLLGSDNAAKVLFLFVREIQREAEDRPEDVSEAAYAASLRAVFCNRVDSVLVEFRELGKEERKEALFSGGI